MRETLTADAYVKGVRAGDRAVLARAITLVESRNADHEALAQEVLTALLPDTGNALRVGITGVPGVGKSTFIDALGTMLTGLGHKVAVLAVDPTSKRSGGSILGDKTRMARLAHDPNAYIRPSPAGTTLGGVTRTTRETMTLAEAAGFDIVLVETVGVGQSETMVADMVDVFLVLILPGAGDDLQGIKKGVLEVADILAVNKADGDNIKRAETAARDLRAALRLIEHETPDWTIPIHLISALKETGLNRLWETVVEYRDLLAEKGLLEEKRRDQQLRWLWSLIEDRLMTRFRAHAETKARLAEMEAKVAAGEITAPLAADALLKGFLGRP